MVGVTGSRVTICTHDTRWRARLGLVYGACAEAQAVLAPCERAALPLAAAGCWARCWWWRWRRRRRSRVAYPCRRRSRRTPRPRRCRCQRTAGVASASSASASVRRFVGSSVRRFVGSSVGCMWGACGVGGEFGGDVRALSSGPRWVEDGGRRGRPTSHVPLAPPSPRPSDGASRHGMTLVRLVLTWFFMISLSASSCGSGSSTGAYGCA